MNRDSDPMRLTEPRADAPDEIRELLAHAKEDVPSDDEVEHLAARLAFLLLPAATAAGAAAGAGTAGAMAGSTAAKVGAAVVVGGALVGGAAYLATSGEEPRMDEAPPVVVASAPTTVEASSAAEPAAPSSRSALVVEAPSATAAEPEPPPSTTEASKAKAPSEAQLLQSAQAALRSDPGRALRLVQEHRRRYPNGALAQEREVIAIEALSRMGREDEARGRAERFKQKYPGSAHDRKVDTTVPPDRSK